MNLFEQPSFKLNNRLLSFVGLWPYHDRKTRLPRVYFINFVMMSFNLTQIFQLYTAKGDLDIIVEVIPTMIAMIYVTIKYHTYHMGIYNIRTLLDNMVIDWRTWNSKEEIEIMKKYAEEARLYTLGYTIYIYMATILFLSISFVPCLLDIIIPLNESRPLKPVILGEYFVNQQDNFYPIFFHLAFTILLSMTALIAADAQFFIFICHVCSIFSVIGFRFEHFLKDDITLENLSSRQREDSLKYIILSIRGHRKAIEFTNFMESSFSVPFLTVFVLNIPCLSFSLYRIVILMGQLTEVFRYVAFLTAQLFHMFCISYSGQKIINHSNDIYFKAYSGRWYEAPIKIQELLILVIRRSLEPTRLTAKGLFVFCYESFAAIVQTSVSYFTILLSLR